MVRGVLGPKRLVSVELLGNGKSNTSYKVLADNGAAYVLRLYSQGSPAREACVMDMAKDFVPVPAELDRGDTWSFTTFLDGDILERRPEHSGKAAEALARIASVAFDSPGWINSDGTVSPFPFDGISGFVSDMLNREEVLCWTGQAIANAVAKAVADASDLIEILNAESYLVHGDFNPTNILIKNGEVSGVLDWEYSHSGTPFMDIGNLLRHTNPRYHPLIERGLRAAGMNLPEDWLLRARLVDLTSHLEFLTTARSDAFKRECVGRIEAFLRTFGGRE